MTFGPGEADPSQFPEGGTQARNAPAALNRVTFTRRELNRILDLYGRMVAAGEWRDYAIDFLKDRAVFWCSAAHRKCRSTASKKIRSWSAARAPTA